MFRAPCHSYTGDGSSRGLLASIENVNPSHLQCRRRGKVATGSGVQCYAWHVPGGSLPERKVRAEGRREELLSLLYQDKLNADQAQELVREWLDLVRERDKLLHEEIQQENSEEKEEYLRDLRAFLGHIPLAEQSYEERQLKDCLRMLEKQVTNYCNSHNIDIARPRLPAWRSVPGGLDREPSAHHHLRPMLPDHALDAEKESRMHTRSVSPMHVSGQGSDIDGLVHIARAAPILPLTGHAGSVPQTSTERRDSAHKRLRNSSSSTCNVVQVEAVVESVPHHKAGNPSQNDSPPSTLPPPPPPPPPPPLPLPLQPIFSGAAKAAGTGQFVSHTPHNPQEPQTPTANRGRQSNPKMERSFLDEIASIGQTKLRATKRPRSPGGTPLKTPATGKTNAPSVNDKIQQALLSKFKTLQSTPIKRQTIANEHMDFSNQWSDIHSFEDPDFTSGNITSGMLQVSSPNISQGFSPSASKMSTPKPGKGASSSVGKKGGKSTGKKKPPKGQGVSPNTSRKSTNTSTAV